MFKTKGMRFDGFQVARTEMRNRGVVMSDRSAEEVRSRELGAVSGAQHLEPGVEMYSVGVSTAQENTKG